MKKEEVSKLSNQDKLDWIVAAFITVFGVKKSCAIYCLYKKNKPLGQSAVRLGILNLVESGYLDDCILFRDEEFLTKIARGILKHPMIGEWNIEEIRYW